MNTAIARIANTVFERVMSADIGDKRKALHETLNETMPAYSEGTRALVYCSIIERRAGTIQEIYDALRVHI